MLLQNAALGGSPAAAGLLLHCGLGVADALAIGSSKQLQLGLMASTAWPWRAGPQHSYAEVRALPRGAHGTRKCELAVATGGKCGSKCRPPQRAAALAAPAAGGPSIYSLFETGRTTKEGRGCCVLAKQSVHEPTSGRAHGFLDCLQKTARRFLFLRGGSDRGAASSAGPTPTVGMHRATSTPPFAEITPKLTLLSGCCRDCACPLENNTPAMLCTAAHNTRHSNSIQQTILADLQRVLSKP